MSSVRFVTSTDPLKTSSVIRIVPVVSFVTSIVSVFPETENSTVPSMVAAGDPTSSLLASLSVTVVAEELEASKQLAKNAAAASLTA